MSLVCCSVLRYSPRIANGRKGPNCWSPIRHIIKKLEIEKGSTVIAKLWAMLKCIFFFFYKSMLDVPWNSLHPNLLATSIYFRAAESWENWSQLLTNYLVLRRLPKSLILSTKLSRKINAPLRVWSPSKPTKVHYFLGNVKARNNIFLPELNKI